MLRSIRITGESTDSSFPRMKEDDSKYADSTAKRRLSLQGVTAHSQRITVMKSLRQMDTA